MKPQKIITATLLMMSLTIVSFAEGNKKAKRNNANPKACVERIIKEIINEELDTFSFNQDLATANQQFQEVYQETTIIKLIESDLAFAEKLFFNVDAKNEMEVVFQNDMEKADELFYAIESKEAL